MNSTTKHGCARPVVRTPTLRRQGKPMSDDETKTGRSYQVRADLRPPRYVSMVCLVGAAGFFAVAWVLAYIAASDIIAYFYQPRVLAVVHSLTLGWISLTMMGVLYQFIPALTKRRVSWPGGAIWQVVLFIAGAIGMVVSFWFGRLEYTAWSAAVEAVAILLFVAQILPALLGARRTDATTIGVFFAAVFYATTATLGLLYAWDKLYGFLGGSVLSNIAAHAHFGLVGWVTLTICALSYRVVTAFLLPTTPLPESARSQVVALAIVVPTFGVALLARSRWAVVPALAGFGCMLWYVVILVQIARTRRMPIDWTMRHIVAALIHLFAGLLCGISLFVIDPHSNIGSRLAATYGLLVLVGWISNYIVGIGSRMAPPLIGLGPEPLLVGGSAAAVFVLLNGAVATMTVSILVNSPLGLRAAILALFVSAFVLIGHLVKRIYVSKSGDAARPRPTSNRAGASFRSRRVESPAP